MPEIYEAIMQGDRIVEWIGMCPPQVEAGLRVKVSITIIETVPSGEAMAEIMNRMAKTIDVQAIFGDASEWQREVRKDRPLPGRD